MKKLLVMAAMVLSSVGAFAQHSAGEFTLQPRIGLNVSDVSNVNDSKTRAGINAGVEAEYYVKNWLGISAGIMYSQQGVRTEKTGNFDFGDDTKFSGTIKNTFKFDYINIPILANFYVAKGLALKTGIQPSFLVNHKLKTEVSSMGASAEKSGTMDGVNSFDFCIPVGISYEYCGFILDARANFSLTDTFKNDTKDYDKSSKNEVLQLTFGYKFTL